MSGARMIVLAGTIAALALDDADAEGEDATATALLEACDALLDPDLTVLVAATDEVADAAEEGSTVVIDTPGSVARLDRRLDAAEGSRVRVSDGAVDVEAEADAMVATDRLVSAARLDRRLEAADGSSVEVSEGSV